MADANRIVSLLLKRYPDPRLALNYTKPLELLIAVILSAQCTDVRVNIVTADLFRKYPQPRHYVSASQEEIEQDVRTTGFFRNKAKNIRATAEKIIEEFDGEVPQTMDELLSLNGVARKTANVVLGNAFGIASGVVVDTHVKRLSNRLGLTKETNPVKVENDLVKLVPKKDWVMFSHWLIWHGREICKARKPNCDECTLNDICPKIGV